MSKIREDGSQQDEKEGGSDQGAFGVEDVNEKQKKNKMKSELLHSYKLGAGRRCKGKVSVEGKKWRTISFTSQVILCSLVITFIEKKLF